MSKLDELKSELDGLQPGEYRDLDRRFMRDAFAECENGGTIEDFYEWCLSRNLQISVWHIPDEGDLGYEDHDIGDEILYPPYDVTRWNTIVVRTAA